MPTLTPGDGQDLIARYKFALERRDPDLALELFREDAEYRPDPFEPALVGSNAIRESWNGIAASRNHVEFDAEHIWVSGATVLASWHGTYTVRATTERVRTLGFMTLELDDDGLISRLREWPLSRRAGVVSDVQTAAF